MKRFWYISSSLLLLFILSCIGGNYSTTKQSLVQEVSLGEIRSNITHHFHNRFETQICWTSNSSVIFTTQILSGVQAYNMLQEFGHNYGQNENTDFYLNELSTNEIKAVLIEVIKEEQVIKSIFVPNTLAPGKGMFFDKLANAESDQTCYTCTCQDGERNPPCKCTYYTAKSCGTPPPCCAQECPASCYNPSSNIPPSICSNLPYPNVPFSDPIQFVSVNAGVEIPNCYESCPEP